MSKIMNDNFKINVGNPIDSRYLASTNLPYASTIAVNTAIVQSQRYVGLTVNINNVEYWYETSVLDGSLIIKDSGLASTGVTAAYNGITKEGNAVKLGGTLTGATTFIKSGTGSLLKYAGDYSGEFDAQTLVDAEYVTGKTSQSVITSSNGLTKVGQDVKLGGTTALDETTNICGGLQVLNLGTAASKLGAFTINANSAAIITTGTTEICPTGELTLDGSAIAVKAVASYDDDKSGNYTLRSIPDVNYVTGLTTTSGIQTASNGLTKTGTNVTLGGTLTSDTQINLNNGNCFELCDTGNATSYIFDLTGVTLNNNDSIFEIGNSGDDYILTHCSGSNVNLTSSGLTYGGDYSSCFKENTLVTKAYVDSASGGILANNGLTRQGCYISLGGDLTGDTNISGSDTLTVSAPYIANDIQHFIFDNSPTISGSVEGRLYYQNCQLNFDREISGVTLQIGEEEVIRVENLTGDAILNGKVVYVNGASISSGLPTVALADATDFTKATQTIGISTQEIGNNEEGYITVLGIIHDVNTNGFAAGDLLWLSTTAGEYTNVRPSYPNFSVNIGLVTKVGLSDGELYTKILYVPNYTEYGLFTGYTASTNTLINTKLDTSIYLTYTGITDGRLDVVESITDVAITGVTNGLTNYSTHNACLGGTLSSDVTLSGAQLLTMGDLNGICMSVANTNDIGLNAKSNGAIYVKSQSGTVASSSDMTTAVGISLDYNASVPMLVTDNRPTPRGLQYADDYTSTYLDRSLVDKYYVDSIATGLNVHAAVVVATTPAGGNIGLSGLTTIDGVTLSDSDRVLVKDQTDGAFNGIYAASATTWGRTEDYNFEPSGEISNGDLIPVISGTSNTNSQWILVTTNPIISGDTLTFSVFSQQQGIIEGDGICVTTVGSNKQVAVKLSPSASGLCFDATALELDYTIFRYGLTCNVTTGNIDVNALYGDSIGTKIPVRIDTGGTNNLYVDQACFSYTTASNGLTKVDTNVTLGGALTGDTNVNGAGGIYDLGFTSLDTLTLDFNSSNITNNSTGEGLVYGTDYSSTFIDNSLVSKYFVNNAITGTTLTYCDGLTKTADVIQWGGSMTTDRALLRGSTNLCVKETGFDIITDCSCILSTNSAINIRTCNDTTCDASIGLTDTGIMALVANNATQGITITSAAHGVVYAGAYKGDFVCHSLVDVDYVTGLTTTSGIQTASNGLTKTGTEVKLGGTLTGDTTITGGGYVINLGTGGSQVGGFGVCNNGDVNITSDRGILYMDTCEVSLISCFDVDNYSEICLDQQGIEIDFGTGSTDTMFYSDDYSANFTARSIPDVEWVTGQTSSAGIQTACNGLTKTGTEVKLGGTLTGDTCIDTNNQFGIAIGNNVQATGNNSFAIGYGESGGNGPLASGNHSFAGGSGFYQKPIAGGDTSFVFSGDYSCACGIESSVLGGKYNQITSVAHRSGILGGENNCITAINSVILGGSGGCVNGTNSVILGGSGGNIYSGVRSTIIGGNAGYISGDDSAIIVSNAGYIYGSNNVAIIGGINNSIHGSNHCSVIIGGNNIDVANSSLPNHAIVPNLAIFTTPVDDNDGAILVWDSTTKKVGKTTIGSLGGVTGGTNGLTLDGQDIKLGGTLSETTTINGAQTLNMNVSNVNITGATDITGVVTMSSTLDVTGAIDSDSTLDILGAASLHSTLDVTGATQIGGNLTLDTVGAGDVGTDDVMMIDSSGVVKKTAVSTLGEDNNMYDMTIVITDVLLTTGSTYVQLVNVPTSGITITLPATPTNGQVFRIKDAAGSALNYNITIARNGKLIDGGTENGVLNTDNGALEIVYNNALGSWFVFSFVN